MSDNIEELAKQYEENVPSEHPRSIGLFTIPEYPEYESKRGMWSATLEAILTTLRYLAPATLLTLFWGQQSFLFKILKHIDSAFRAVLFSNEEQKQGVLQWLAETGPARIEHLETVWRHGWILCGMLDAALPGACAGHPPTRLSLKHAQAIADNYLGVEPVFSRQELESNDSLCRHQEWKLVNYLDRIRQALAKLTPVSKPPSQRTSPETTQFTIDYVVKGSGLSAAQINNKAFFKIYPTAQQTLDPGEITILIRGPKDTYGLTVLPPILGKAQMIRQNLLGLQSKQHFTENILPITQGAAYLRSYGKNDMNKTYYIPKTKYDIEIEAESHQDHVKICYVVNLEGKYEVSLTSRGQNIVGSPFTVTASDSIIGILEKESFCLEDGEEIDIVDVKTDRKVVLRIVDFVTEKMLLKENGALEKITEDEAKILMNTEVENKRLSSDSTMCSHIATDYDHRQLKHNKFNDVAHKILKMNRVCKIFNDLMVEKQIHSIKKGNSYNHSRTQQDIPDIVNSTFNDSMNPFIVTGKRDKFIVPESISVSICTEKSKAFYEEVSNAIVEIDKAVSDIAEYSSSTSSPNSLDKLYEEQIDDDISIDRMTPLSNNNPFLTDICEENYIAEKSLGTFVTTEYETNNLQNEKTEDSSIKLFAEINITQSPSSNNPFIDTNVAELDRPKTPVHKIISGGIANRDESVYLNPKSELISEEMLSNEFINPFFMHHLQSNHQYEQPPITDFIIGAPVSLPPILIATSPEQDHSLKTTKNEHLHKIKNKDLTKEPDNNDMSPSVCLTTLHKNVAERNDTGKINNNFVASSTFQSLESNLPESDSNTSTNSNNQLEAYRVEELQLDQDLSHKKDIWDSAYVSIDDNASSPDSNNNENTILYESQSKQSFSPSDDICRFKQETIHNMGPAEREIWQTCSELNDATKPLEDMKPQKWDIKRQTFTPIIEESERCISSGMKDLTRSETSMKHSGADPVTEAFAELNGMFHEYFPKSESSIIQAATEDNKLRNIEVEYTVETNDTSVDSASEILSDVMRHEIEMEGTISEVQANVSESVSVSQTLQNTNNEKFYPYNKHTDETQFGDNKRINIVLERKKYWDDKIRQIEANSEESTTYQKKRRISSKQLKHSDSLSKRRGKQIVKKILNAGTGFNQIKSTRQGETTNPEITFQVPITNNNSAEVKTGVKIVEKWKKYWDDKLEIESEDSEMSSLRINSRNKDNKTSTPSNSPVNDQGSTLKIQLPGKQELPEEVFKAFETSPKRFFGTCRKHILNKIDTFLGNPSTVDNSLTETSAVIPDTGLVSSRISLFHKMTNTEPLPWTKMKCKSLQNIYQRKDSENNITSVDGLLVELPKKYIQTKIFEPTEKVLNVSEKITTDAKAAENISLKDKRARMVQQKCKSFDETDYQKTIEELKVIENPKLCVKRTVDDLSKQSKHLDKHKNNDVLRRTSISKSEMDIFNKVPYQSDDSLDKYKSCDELPKINVKNFISLYESVSKTAMDAKSVKGMYTTSSVDSSKQLQTISTTLDAENKLASQHHKTVEERGRCNTGTIETKKHTNNMLDSVNIERGDAKADNDSNDAEIIPKEEKETTYLSLSDIELEIVENTPENERVLRESSIESTPEHINYKNRFKMAKQYFQSLEELRELKKPRKLNECELLLLNKSTESLENDRPQKRVKKKTKSYSMPSSEISKVWDQMQENKKQPDSEADSTKLTKISEKFNVDDLFSDVMEGKLGRQGSLRGIPHKKAVLETFRSMENIADSKMSPYEFGSSQLSDFAQENRIKNAQTYLNEYPYLPTTDPSKYHSRLDTKASGLISFKELLENKGRRNSVPDLRWNPKFTVEL